METSPKEELSVEDTLHGGDGVETTSESPSSTRWTRTNEVNRLRHGWPLVTGHIFICHNSFSSSVVVMTRLLAPRKR